MKKLSSNCNALKSICKNTIDSELHRMIIFETIAYKIISKDLTIRSKLDSKLDYISHGSKTSITSLIIGLFTWNKAVLGLPYWLFKYDQYEKNESP